MITTPPLDHLHPIAYLSLSDPAARAAISNVLADTGWTVINEPTGFHLLQAIADLIEDERSWRRRPSMIVIDALARGCSGVSIARGLRDLGITIPIVLVAAPGAALPVSPDATLRIVDDASAASTVAELAGTGPIRRRALGSHCRVARSEVRS
jgi:CheY-like chemotaxis protein